MYVDRSINEDDCNLFSCLSRNPWLAQWIFQILSILVLMWICCDTMATAVVQYIPAERLFDDHSLGSPVEDCCGECCRPSCRCCSRRAVCLSSILLAVGTVLAAVGVILALVFGIPKPPPVNRVCRTADNSTGFLCDDRVTCIPPSDLCNGVVTCPKGADEDTHMCSDLPNNLPGGLVFRCGNPKFWVFTDKKCNGFNDCGDCSDEIGPYAGCSPCGVYWWPCIPVDFQYCSCIPRCLCRDGRQHCYDWSDEYTCPKSLTC